jgi:hypothetical protein
LFLHQTASELVSNRVVHENAFDGGAALAGIAKAAFGREVRREVEVGVIEDDERIIAAKFEDQALITGKAGDAFANRDAAGEAYHLDARILDQRFGDFAGWGRGAH